MKAPEESQSEAGALSFALRSLRSRNYRLFFGGQSVSLIGTWMTRLATSWLVYRLTDSAFLLGLVGFAGQIPAFVLGPIAGAWVDRLDRHRVLLATQVLSMVQSFWLAALALTNSITFWDVLWLSVFQGVVNAFDMPARQAFLTEMVESRDDLPNAIALNSSMFNGSRLVGPALAGVVVAAVGEGYCFLIDGISYIAVIASLLAMRLVRRHQPKRETSVVADVVEGWRYVSGFAPVRSVLLLLALVSLVGMPYTVLMPVMARTVLGGGPNTMGWLMGASGVGALVSALALAGRRSVLGLGRLIPISAAIFGVGLVAFGVSRWLPLSLVLMLLTGYGLMQQMAASNTILQTVVEEDKRGRVMSFYAMAFLGTAPFGSLAGGFIADRIGAPATLVIGGVVCMAGAVWFARRLDQLRRLVRPIYVRLGIIPEVATGLQSATNLQQVEP